MGGPIGWLLSGAKDEEGSDGRKREAGRDSRNVRRSSLHDMLVDWVLEEGEEDQG